MGLERELPAGLAVSAVALACDAGALHWLIEHAAWPVQRAAATGFLVGLVVNYLLSVRYVFSQHALQSRTAEMLAFAAIGLGGIAVNALAFAVAVDHAKLHHLVGKALAAALTFSFNFGLRRRLLFTRRSTTPHA